MKKNSATEPEHTCEFCHRSFQKEKTALAHVCEYKHRWQERDKKASKIAYQAWLQFYVQSGSNKKNREYTEFIRSAYYNAFAKFGTYVLEINALNVNRFIDWLLKERIKIDLWTHDTTYNKFLIEYLRMEDPMDAIARSVGYTMELAQLSNINGTDCLRFGNPNRICQLIVNGRVSPWMLYQSDSGVEFLSKLSSDQVKMISDYINPEQWAIKFMRDKEMVKEVKSLLKTGGY